MKRKTIKRQVPDIVSELLAMRLRHSLLSLIRSELEMNNISYEEIRSEYVKVYNELFGEYL